LFSIRGGSGAQANRFAQRPLERLYLTLSCPEFELGVGRCAQFDEKFFPAIVELDAAHQLGVAAVQGFGEAENCGQRADGFPLLCAQLAEADVRLSRRGFPMITGDQRDDLGLFGLEPAQIAVFDQVIRMLVVARIADVRADVVE
jgi:hypothetical protein